MCDVRIVACPYCEGEGRWESAPYGVNYNDGSPLTYIEECDDCHGEGWAIVAVLPCTLEDLDEIDELERSAG